MIRWSGLGVEARLGLIVTSVTQYWRGEDAGRSAEVVPLQPPTELHETVRSGWPVAALTCGRTQTRHQEASPFQAGPWRGGIVAPAFLRPRSLPLSSGSMLPLTPVWPGFAIDTAIYASLAAVVLYGPTLGRRRLRRRRGCCETCGYSLTGLTPGFCPECGTNIGAQASP